jgi:YesN/AraC family two-component response regulator
MQKACQLLYTEDSRVKQIAALLGYDDPYYFSRLFKKYMNTSPETYRKSVRKIH